MSDPREGTEGNNLRPGQHDEGGHGGMATRELEARGRAEEGADERAVERAEERAEESADSGD